MSGGVGGAGNQSGPDPIVLWWMIILSRTSVGLLCGMIRMGCISVAFDDDYAVEVVGYYYKFI